MKTEVITGLPEPFAGFLLIFSGVFLLMVISAIILKVLELIYKLINHNKQSE